MPKVFTSKSQKTGEHGEDLAVKYLEYLGYEIMERNFTKKFGELDIVARKEGKYYFIEVKSRNIMDVASFKLNEADITRNIRENLTTHKIERLKRTIETYVASKGMTFEKIDFVFVLLGVIYIQEIGKAKFIFEELII